MSGKQHFGQIDNSNFATRAVLSQAQANSTYQPIAFMSKGLSDVEQNYQIHDKEMLAIMCVVSSVVDLLVQHPCLLPMGHSKEEGAGSLINNHVSSSSVFFTYFVYFIFIL